MDLWGPSEMFGWRPCADLERRGSGPVARSLPGHKFGQKGRKSVVHVPGVIHDARLSILPGF